MYHECRRIVIRSFHTFSIIFFRVMVTSGFHMKRSGLKASKDFLLVSQPPRCVPSAANMVTSQAHLVLKLICFLILHLCWKVSYYHTWLEFLKMPLFCARLCCASNYASEKTKAKCRLH